MAVVPARLERSNPGTSRFVPAGENRPRPTGANFAEEEWFAEGEDDQGRRWRTQMLVRRPRDPAQFSGTVLVEPLHVHRIAPLFMYCSPYLLRSGHGWVCVVSQKVALEAHVKPADPERYAGLDILADPAPAGAPTDLLTPPFRNSTDAERGDWWRELARANAASSAILAQVGAALRGGEGGPFAGYQLRDLLLGGHSQTGFVTTNYLREAHGSARLAGGKPIYDGFFPSGFPAGALGPCDVPIVQTLSEGDIANPHYSFDPNHAGRSYRRADSDDLADRYRLYELAGVPHAVTRGPPFNDPRMWQDVSTAVPVPLDSVMNSLPHNQLFEMTLHHLIDWVAKRRVPPRADRIATDAGGWFAADANGNSRGGVRCVQMDVPRATYLPNPPGADGRPTYGTVGVESPFTPAEMARRYGSPANYHAAFAARLDELIGEGWLLPEDRDEMLGEAAAQNW